MARLAQHGIAVDLPRGWDGRIKNRSRSDGTFRIAAEGEDGEDGGGALLHAGTFPLPDGRGDFGGGAVETMRRGDVFVALFEYDRSSAGTALFAADGVPQQLQPADFDGRSLQRLIPGHLGLQRFFSENGRAFCLYVVVADDGDLPSLVREANRMLASLAISGSDAGP